LGRINVAWGACITDLLKRHNLSTRAAEIKCEGAVSNSYIYMMMTGKLPEQETAIKFLQHFPKDEAVECLKAGGFDIPENWQTPQQSVIEAVELAMRVSGKFTDVTEERKEVIRNQIVEFIEKAKAKYEK
jgi:predicted transcriptional regulator